MSSLINTTYIVAHGVLVCLDEEELGHLRMSRALRRSTFFSV